MISWDQRNRQRGGYTQPQFLLKMRESGFSEVPPSPAPNHGFVLHEFTHPAAGDHRFQVKAGVSYAKAVRDFTAELEQYRAGAEAV